MNFATQYRPIYHSYLIFAANVKKWLHVAAGWLVYQKAGRAYVGLRRALSSLVLFKFRDTVSPVTTVHNSAEFSLVAAA